jgi:hypothetical protein
MSGMKSGKTNEKILYPGASRAFNNDTGRATTRSTPGMHGNGRSTGSRRDSPE